MHIEYQTDTNKRAHAQNKQNRITFVPKTGKEHLQLPFKYTRTTWFLQTVVTAVTCFLLQHCNSSAPVKTLANSCQALRLCVHVVLADASLAFSLLGIGRLRTKIPLAVDWSIYKYEPTRSQAYPHSEHRFPAPSSKLCQIWLRHWRGTLYLCAAVQRRGQSPPKGSGTDRTVEAT